MAQAVGRSGQQTKPDYGIDAPGVIRNLFVAAMACADAGVLEVHEIPVLDMVKWRGDECVLDVGCGAGLVLIGAAKRLTTGKATGIDVC